MKDVFLEGEQKGNYIANINAYWQNMKINENITLNAIPFAYIDGFKQAGDTLIESLGDGDNPIMDELVFPIVFNYRQYLELVFKNFYFNIYQDRQVQISFIKRVSHSLRLIFDKCTNDFVNYLEDIDNKDTNYIFNRIQYFIYCFDEVDQNSFNFRYFFNRKDITATIPNPISINLCQLKKEIDFIEDIMFITYNGC